MNNKICDRAAMDPVMVSIDVVFGCYYDDDGDEDGSDDGGDACDDCFDGVWVCGVVVIMKETMIILMMMIFWI